MVFKSWQNAEAQVLKIKTQVLCSCFQWKPKKSWFLTKLYRKALFTLADFLTNKSYQHTGLTKILCWLVRWH